MLPAIGEFHLLSRDGWIAITTLASVDLSDEIARKKPVGVSIVGKTETENIGIEKVIKNILALPNVSYLIICGNESNGHYSGDTLLSIVKNGVTNDKKVIGSLGKKSILKNITIEEIEYFRENIEVINMIGNNDMDNIINKIGKLKFQQKNKKTKINIEERVIIKAEVKDPNKVKLDKLGYFVITPNEVEAKITVEHYGNDNKLLHIIEGYDARNIYWNIIENGWISEMSHSAYLGKELARAELSMKYNFKYIQDKA